MRLASPRVFWFALLPAAVLVLAAWLRAGTLARRHSTLAGEITRLRAELAAAGFEPTAEALREREDFLRRETAGFRSYTEQTGRLARDPLVRDHENLPFQLIEFERERANLAQRARDAATAAKVKLAPSAFDILAADSAEAARPRHRWAQLAVAREIAARAITARVGTYEALPVPAVREVRTAKDQPVLTEQILFSVRVTGDSARVQDFIELLALGAAPEDLRFVFEHLVLRKDGTSAPDLASATVVVAAFLPPPATPPAGSPAQPLPASATP